VVAPPGLAGDAVTLLVFRNLLVIVK